MIDYLNCQKIVYTVYLTENYLYPSNKILNGCLYEYNYFLKKIIKNVFRELLSDIFHEIYSEKQSATTILVMVHDDRTASQLREYLQLGGENMMKLRFSRYLKQSHLKFSKQVER